MFVIPTATATNCSPPSPELDPKPEPPATRRRAGTNRNPTSVDVRVVRRTDMVGSAHDGSSLRVDVAIQGRCLIDR